MQRLAALSVSAFPVFVATFPEITVPRYRRPAPLIAHSSSPGEAASH